MYRSGLIKSMFIIFLLVLSPFSITWAYVGPVVGITMLGTFWTFIVVILAAVGGLLVWPLRSFWRWKKERSGKIPDDDADKE